MSPILSSRNVPAAFVVFLILIALVNLALIAPYLLAVFLGWLLATVLKPVQARFLGWGWRESGSALASTMVATFTIILPIVGFGFLTVKSLVKMITPYTKGNLPIDEWVAKIQALPLVSRFVDNPEEIKSFLSDTSQGALQGVGGLLTGFLSAAPEVLLQLALALLTTYFVLLEGGKLRAWMGPRIPLPSPVKKKLAEALNDTAFSSFLSMFVASLAQAIVVLVGFIVLKVPMAMLAFGVAFIFAWFPILGVTPVWAAAAAYLFISDRTGAGVGMIAFGFVAGIADNVTRPWVLKGRSDIHPLVSLVAIFGSIHFFGIIGVLVGPVLASCLIEVLKIWPEYQAPVGLDPSRELIKNSTE